MAFRLNNRSTDDRAAYRAARLEHIIYSVFRDHNEQALSDPRYVDMPGRGTVTLSRMRWLRDTAVARATRAAAAHDARVRQAVDEHGAESAEALRALMADHDQTAAVVRELANAIEVGGDFVYDDVPRGADAWEAPIAEFNRVLGVTAPASGDGRDGVVRLRAEDGTTELRGAEHGLLVSPLDPAWRDRDVMSHAGAHEALVAADSVPDEIAPGEPVWIHDIGSTEIPTMWGVRLTEWPVSYFNGPGSMPTPVALGSRNGAGMPARGADGRFGLPSWSMADETGLVQLRRFTDQGTFSRVSRRVLGQWQGADASDVANMRRAVTDMADILDTLVSEGHEVSISTGERAGTVEAKIDDDDVYVRVFDTPGQSRYLGRSYSNGAVWRLGDVRVPGKNATPQAVAAWTRDVAILEEGVTADKRETLVRLAIGESPQETIDALGNAEFTASANRMRIPGAGEGPGTIQCEWRPRSKYLGYDAERPMDRVVEMTRSARANLAAAIDADGLAKGEPAPTDDAAVARARESIAHVIADGGDVQASVSGWLDSMVGTVADAAHGDVDVDAVSRWADGASQFENARTIRSAIEREARLAVTDPKNHRAPTGEAADGVTRAMFDASTARRIGDDGVGHVQALAMGAVTDALSARGVVPTDVAVDDNGIIGWSGTKRVANSDRTVPISGTVGQVFEPEADGSVRCDVIGGDPFVLEPAYHASIIPTRMLAGARAQSVYQRMRVTSDVDDVISEVSRQVARDLCEVRAAEGTGSGEFFDSVGSPTSVNHAWRQASGTRHDPEEMATRASTDPAQHIDPMFDARRLDAERRRVRMDRDVHAGSTTYGIITYVEAPDRDAMALSDDITPKRELEPLVTCGLTDMSSMSNPQCAGVFDPAITAQGRDQGLNKTLVEGAIVDRYGKILPSRSMADRAPVMKDVVYAEGDHDTWLRQQLAAANSMAALEITEPVQVAHVACGGFEQDDAIVISKDFAERYGVVEDGRRRPLTTNDKLSDMHGNKGLVSLVIDPAMSDEEADAKGIRAQRDLFRANPNLSCVMSPFSFISRGNAGTAREGMEAPHDLKIPQADGTYETVPGGSCELHMMVQSHTVDEKSTIYDQEGSDRGRLVGWQLSSGLSAIGAKGLLTEMFAGNEAGLAHVRETMRTLGYDLDESGHVVEGPLDDGRPTVTLPATGRVTEAYLNADGEVRYGHPVSGKTASGQTRHSTAFGVTETAAARQALSREGGVASVRMPLSFSKRYPDGSWDVASPMPEDGTGGHRMPIMGAFDRAGTEFVDGGGSAAHDYTKDYVTILQNDARYSMCEEAALSAADPKPFTDEMDRLVDASNAIYRSIERDVAARQVTAHDNVFKKSGLGVHVGHSATLPWSPDPRLDVQQIAIGREEAGRLGVTDGDPIVLWRDPVLTTSCVRSFTVSVSDDIRGVQVNPVVAGAIGGDFDGDTIGIYVPQTDAGRADCANVLDFSHNLVGSDDDIAVGLGLDIGLARAEDTSLQRDFEDMQKVVGDQRSGEEALGALNDFVHKAQRGSFGEGCLRYTSAEDNVRSIYDACVATHVKGSVAKLEHDYCRNLGVEVVGGLVHDDGTWNDGCIRDTKETRLTPQQNEATQFATHAKAAYTGLSGYTMQLALELASTDEEVRAATTLTEQIYQHTLDYKTNDQAAREETPAISALSDTLRGIKYELPVRYEADVHGGKRPVFQREAGAKRGEMSAEEIAEQYRAISHVFGIEPNERVLKTVSEIPALHDRKFLLSGAGGSAMHVLAFEPSRALERLQTFADYHEGLYDGPITRDIAPASVREAQGQARIEHEGEAASRMLDVPSTFANGVDYAAVPREAQAQAEATRTVEAPVTVPKGAPEAQATEASPEDRGLAPEPTHGPADDGNDGPDR